MDKICLVVFISIISTMLFLTFHSSVLSSGVQTDLPVISKNMGKGDKMFLTAQQAATIANQEITQFQKSASSEKEEWQNAEVGTPVLVNTLSGTPSYWLVPVNLENGQIGFIRILGSGVVAAVGQMGQEAVVRKSKNQSVVTGLSMEKAAMLASKHINSSAGEKAAKPVFVHDGPPGREAWMVVVSQNGIPTRWLFLTPGGRYERPAGTTLDQELE